MRYLPCLRPASRHGRCADADSNTRPAAERAATGEDMRTAIAGGWIVGHQGGRHGLIRDGVVVYEGNKIVYVGKNFDGRVDNTIDAAGKLVAPGFIDTHVHAGHRASHRLITDTGRPMYYGQPFLEISVPRKGKKVVGDVRWIKHGEG